MELLVGHLYSEGCEANPTRFLEVPKRLFTAAADTLFQANSLSATGIPKTQVLKTAQEHDFRLKT